MRTSKAYDHDGLVTKDTINARNMLSKVLAMMSNQAMCEDRPNTWNMSTNVPIFRVRDPMELGNYHTIIFGHIG